MKSVLIIDYYFPPIAGPGVRRTLGYLNHLPSYGWSPLVLTVRSGESSFYDASLLAQVPDGIPVYRTSSIEPVRFVKEMLKRRQAMRGDGHPEATGAGRPVWRGTSWLRELPRWILFPERRVGWLPFAFLQGRRLLREFPVDVIYSTSTAVTSHLIAYLLREESGKPWVADFQDPWSQNVQYPSRIHKAAARRLEERVLRSADRIIVTTEHHRRMLLAGFSSLTEDKVTVIPMGYDPEIFEGIEVNTKPRFVITHFGNFYATRSPASFLRAVAECLQSSRELAEDLEVRFVGHFNAEMLAVTERILKELRLGEVVRLEGTVPYKVGLQLLLNSEVLLFIGDKGIWGRVMSSSKLAEYLGARKPILALVPEGAIATTIREARAGLIVDPDDARGIRAAVLSLYDEWRSGRLGLSINHDVLESLTWRRLTERLVSVMEGVLRLSAQMG